MNNLLCLELSMTPDVIQQTAPLRVLELFTETFSPTIEEIVIERLQMAMFDGRTFAHDAGKIDLDHFDPRDLRLYQEADLVVALDTLVVTYEDGRYDPRSPFLG
jgi:hypothetical protein